MSSPDLPSPSAPVGNLSFQMLIGVTLVLALAALACLLLDVPVATVFCHQQLPQSIDRPLREGLEICESFGHGFGATLIIIAVCVLDPSKRKRLGWLIAGSLGSGLAANTMKVLVHRTRPRDFSEMTSITVWDTFASAATGGMGTQSFPSAHTATAVGLAVMLSALYPRGRIFFFVMAVLVGMQRIVSSAHFPSDVFAGAMVGWIVASLLVAAMIKAEAIAISK